MVYIGGLVVVALTVMLVFPRRQPTAFTAMVSALEDAGLVVVLPEVDTSVLAKIFGKDAHVLTRAIGRTAGGRPLEVVHFSVDRPGAATAVRCTGASLDLAQDWPEAHFLRSDLVEIALADMGSTVAIANEIGDVEVWTEAAAEVRSRLDDAALALIGGLRDALGVSIVGTRLLVWGTDLAPSLAPVLVEVAGRCADAFERPSVGSGSIPDGDLS